MKTRSANKTQSAGPKVPENEHITILKAKRKLKLSTKTSSTTTTTTTTTKSDKAVVTTTTSTTSTSSSEMAAEMSQEIGLFAETTATVAPQEPLQPDDIMTPTRTTPFYTACGLRRQVTLPHSAGVTMLCVQEPLIVGASEKHIVVWSDQFVELLRREIMGEFRITSIYVASHANGKQRTLFVGLHTGHIFFWEHGFQHMEVFPHFLDGPVFAFSSDDAHVFAATQSGDVCKWTLSKMQCVQHTSVKYPGLLAMAAVPGKGLLYTSHSDGAVVCWNTCFLQPMCRTQYAQPKLYFTTRDGDIWQNDQAFDPKLQQKRGMLKRFTRGFYLHRGKGREVKVMKLLREGKQYLHSFEVGDGWYVFDLLQKERNGMYLALSDRTRVTLNPL